MQVMQESGDQTRVRLQYTLLRLYKHGLVHSTEAATLYIHPSNTKNVCFCSKWVAGSAEDPSTPRAESRGMSSRKRLLNKERSNSLPQATKEQ